MNLFCKIVDRVLVILYELPAVDLPLGRFDPQTETFKEFDLPGPAASPYAIGMDRNNLRERALEAIRNVKWTPAWGEERISNMIATRPDWCISRQRLWGVPIVVFYCEGCNEPFTDRQVLNRVLALFREQSADIWYSKTAAELAGRVVSEPTRDQIDMPPINEALVVEFYSR